MRKTLSILLVVAICYQAFYNVGLLGYWVVNRAYIATNLCENRDKPELKCDGKCYLKKNMTITSESAPVSTDIKFPSFKKGLEIGDFPPNCEILCLIPSGMPSSAKALRMDWKNLYCFTMENSVFHPPTSLFSSFFVG